MTFPDGVQLATLTFSNSITHLGTPATRTEVTIEPTAGIVWAATGQPVDDFPETVAPGAGLPGSFTAPFVDQPGIKDMAGNDFTMWAYQVTRRTFFGNLMKPVTKNWQPLMGQTTVDFDLLPGGTIGLPVSAPIVPVTSVNGKTLAVSLTKADIGLSNADNTSDTAKPVSTAQQTALNLKLDATEKGAVSGVAPLDSGSRVPEANLPAGLATAALNATYDRAFEPSTSIVYDPATDAVTSSTEGGITTTYTYNADGSVNTETRLGKVRTWAYDGSGNPTSSTVV